MVFRRAAICLMLALSSVISAPAARAAPFTTERLATLDQMADLAIAQFRDRVFLAKITEERPEWLRRYRSITVQIEDAASPGAFAVLEGGRRSIIINRGLFPIIDLYTRYAAARISRRDRASSGCRRYLSDLAERLRAARDASVTEFLASVEAPESRCGIDASASPDYVRLHQQLFDETFPAVVGLILGHEYGHHLLDHLPARRIRPERARQIEFEADVLGSKLLGPNILRAPTVMIFDMLARLRTSDPFRREARSEPAECRFIYFLADDRRYLGEHTAQRIIAAMRQRPDIAERFPDMWRAAFNETGYGPFPNCAMLR